MTELSCLEVLQVLLIDVQETVGTKVMMQRFGI